MNTRTLACPEGSEPKKERLGADPCGYGHRFGLSLRRYKTCSDYLFVNGKEHTIEMYLVHRCISMDAMYAIRMSVKWQCTPAPICATWPFGRRVHPEANNENTTAQGACRSCGRQYRAQIKHGAACISMDCMSAIRMTSWLWCEHYITILATVLSPYTPWVQHK